MAKTEILGIGNLKANFARVKLDMQSRTARGMVVAAGGVLKRKAKAIAQANGSVRTGAMVKNIAIKREASAGAGIEQYNLGVRSGRDLTRKQKKAGRHLVVNAKGRIVVNYANNPYYWPWVEQGHKTRSGSAEVSAKPFIAPALEQGRTQAIGAMAERLNKALEKAGQ